MNETPTRLKLKCEDAEDLKVVSAVLQDALIPVVDMTYRPKERSFIFIANRFRWENEGALLPQEDNAVEESDEDIGFQEALRGPLYERVNAAVTLRGVTKVQTQGIDLEKKDEILNLLAIAAEPGAVVLTFSHGRAIRLSTRRVSLFLADASRPWPTLRQPKHGESEQP